MNLKHLVSDLKKLTDSEPNSHLVEKCKDFTVEGRGYTIIHVYMAGLLEEYTPNTSIYEHLYAFFGASVLPNHVKLHNLRTREFPLLCILITQCIFFSTMLLSIFGSLLPASNNNNAADELNRQ